MIGLEIGDAILQFFIENCKLVVLRYELSHLLSRISENDGAKPEAPDTGREVIVYPPLKCGRLGLAEIASA